jgi:hypothetical protein
LACVGGIKRGAWWYVCCGSSREDEKERKLEEEKKAEVHYIFYFCVGTIEAEQVVS